MSSWLKYPVLSFLKTYKQITWNKPVRYIPLPQELSLKLSFGLSFANNAKLVSRVYLPVGLSFVIRSYLHICAKALANGLRLPGSARRWKTSAIHLSLHPVPVHAVLSRCDEAAAGVVRAGGRLLPAGAAATRGATPGRATPAASSQWRRSPTGGVFCGGGAFGRLAATLSPSTATTASGGGRLWWRAGAVDIIASLRGFALGDAPDRQAAGRTGWTRKNAAALLPPLEPREARRRLQGHPTGNLVHFILLLSYFLILLELLLQLLFIFFL